MIDYVTTVTDTHITVELKPETPLFAPSYQIAVGAFYDRFGVHKWAILASTSPVVQALIKDCSVRRYIDVQNSQLPAGIDMIISAGFAVNKSAILNTPCQPGEEP